MYLLATMHNNSVSAVANCIPSNVHLFDVSTLYLINIRQNKIPHQPCNLVEVRQLIIREWDISAICSFSCEAKDERSPFSVMFTRNHDYQNRRSRRACPRESEARHMQRLPCWSSVHKESCGNLISRKCVIE